MPNHIKNIVHFKCSTTKEREDLTAKLVDGQGLFDFHKVIPMPEMLIGSKSPNRDKEEVAKYIAATGHKDWYDWSIANWGTKWNSYDNNLPYEHQRNGYEDTDVEKEAHYKNNIDAYTDALHVHGTREYLEFNTAWSPPWEIYEKLAKDNPSLEFVVRYSDENSPYQSGIGKFKDGWLYSHKSYSDIYGTNEEHSNWLIDDARINDNEQLNGKELDEDWELVKQHTTEPILNVFTNDTDRHPNLKIASEGDAMTHEMRRDRNACRRYLLREETITPWLCRHAVQATLAYDEDPTLSKFGVCYHSQLERVAHAVEAYHTINSYRKRGLKVIESPNIKLEDGGEPAAYHLTALIADLLKADVVRLHDIDFDVFDYLNDLPDVPLVIVVEPHDRLPLFWEMLKALQEDKDVFIILRGTPPDNCDVSFPIEVKLIGDHIPMAKPKE